MIFVVMFQTLGINTSKVKWKIHLFESTKLLVFALYVSKVPLIFRDYKHDRIVTLTNLQRAEEQRVTTKTQRTPEQQLSSIKTQYIILHISAPFFTPPAPVTGTSLPIQTHKNVSEIRDHISCKIYQLYCVFFIFRESNFSPSLRLI